MTENEALKSGKALYENITLKGNNVIPVAKYIEFVKMANEALEEIQQYRAIGTIEECKNNKVLADKRYEHFFDGMEQLEKYKAIGTVEELQALKEKMQVIQIILEDMKYQIGASGEHMDKKLSEWINKLKG